MPPCAPPPPRFVPPMLSHGSLFSSPCVHRPPASISSGRAESLATSAPSNTQREKAEKAISKEAMETLERQGFVVIDGAISGQDAAKALKGCEMMQRSCSCVCVCVCVFVCLYVCVLCAEGIGAS